MRYLGNKSKLLEAFLLPIIKKELDETKLDIFFDVFSGTGCVGEALKINYNIYACDLLYSSYLISKAKIECSDIPEFEKLGGNLNEIVKILSNQELHDFVSEEYSEGGVGQRLYFSIKNGRKIDGIIKYIHSLKNDQKINELEFSYLYLLFLEAIHSISNTTGVYGAFLKNLSQNALKELNIDIYPIVKSNTDRKVFHGDSYVELSQYITENSVLYLDPPYNNRQYGANYHILETCCYGQKPVIKKVKNKDSKTGLVENLPDSNFCKKAKVKQEFKKYLELPSKLIFISYNSESSLNRTEMEELLSNYGSVQVHEYIYKRYKSNTNIETESNIIEYLYVLKKYKIQKHDLQPIVQWAGGKRRLLPEIKKYIPKKYNHYYEPFLGGGSLLFELCPTNATVVDLNKVLIMTYDIIRTDTQSLLKNLEQLSIEYHDIKQVKGSMTSREEYYKTKRKRFNILKLQCNLSQEERIELSSLFLFLNKTGFNAIYRENSKGEYNVPFGNGKDCTICNRDNLVTMAKYLQNIEIMQGSFLNIQNKVVKGDFVYLDPPYHGTFSNYNSEVWSENDTRNVILLFKTLTEKGVYVILSNNNSEEYKNIVKEIYPDTTKYKFIELSIARTLNSDKTRRQQQNCELLIVGNPQAS